MQRSHRLTVRGQRFKSVLGARPQHAANGRQRTVKSQDIRWLGKSLTVHLQEDKWDCKRRFNVRVIAAGPGAESAVWMKSPERGRFYWAALINETTSKFCYCHELTCNPGAPHSQDKPSPVCCDVQCAHSAEWILYIVVFDNTETSLNPVFIL